MRQDRLTMTQGIPCEAQGLNVSIAMHTEVQCAITSSKQPTPRLAHAT